MERKKALEIFIMVFGLILLSFTLIEYLLSTFSITPEPVLYYWSQIFYLFSIMIFLLLLVIYLEVRNR
ncbi:MAG: hypothetical protein ACFFE6_07890 [Candidatus Thorarchaeota archaeon]